MCFWDNRPVTQGMRVTPGDLVEYRRVHDFKNPCCFCASNGVGNFYVESAIHMAVEGQYAGEYVARCASDSCGYLGKSDS